MKLYQMDISPYTARCRLAIYAKGVEDKVEVIDPGNVKTAEYKAINPMGKIPALITEDGQAIPESDVICEYLEDAFPDTSLTPAAKANIRMVSRVADIYVLNAMEPFFDVAKGGPKVDELLAYGH
ncbi:MAG: glutathione S-transferase family protein, partial [Alphaproteobacteria bacterium]